MAAVPTDKYTYRKELYTATPTCDFAKLLSNLYNRISHSFQLFKIDHAAAGEIAQGRNRYFSRYDGM